MGCSAPSFLAAASGSTGNDTMHHLHLYNQMTLQKGCIISCMQCASAMHQLIAMPQVQCGYCLNKLDAYMEGELQS